MSEENVYPTLSEDSCVSHYNFAKESQQDFNFPEKVYIKDGTLREGEQAAMSGFSLEAKIEIAKMLAEIGVPYIQVGYPGLSESENHMIKEIAKLGLRSKIGGDCLVYLPEWRDQIDQAIDSGVEWIDVDYGLSPIRLKYMMKTPLKDAIDRCLKATEYAAKKNLEICFGATDTTRTPLETLIDLYRRAEAAGAASVSIADTAGAIGPTGMRYLVRQIRQAINIPVVIHCHNDLGLAMANTIAGIEAGASFIDVTVNGLGERSGNASLDEVAAVLTYVYGYDLGLNLKKMRELSRRVSELSRIPVPATKPLAGDSAFTHTLGAHQWGELQGWFVYQPIRAEAVGNKTFLPTGRLTHHLLIRDKLLANGFSGLDENIIQRITEKVRHTAEMETRFVTDEELIAITKNEIA